MSYRIARINEILKKELSYLIQNNLKDPRLSNFISITRVDATLDLRYAKVYITILDNEEKQKEILTILEKASKYLRKNVGKKIKTHYTPELIFVLDDSIKYGMHINKILKDLDHSDKNEEKMDE